LASYDGLRQKPRNKVVILIDEYDSPLLGNLDNIPIARAILKTVKPFFNVIKSSEKKGCIHAVFITGVTKLAKTSLFSGLNNLNDMTLEPEAATLLGYTKEELTTYFKDYAQEFAQKNKSTLSKTFDSIQTWYNGYRFSREEVTVYNPYSVLHFFDKNYLANYWLNTGTPGFLIELLKNQYGDVKKLEKYEVDPTFLGTFEIGELPIVPILYQSGYLTIETYNPETQKYTLKFPNREVLDSFQEYILAALVNSNARNVVQLISQLRQALESNDIEDFCAMFKSMLAGIPSYLHVDREAYYHSIFHIIVNLLGFKGESEVIAAEGRIDFIIDTRQRIFIFEFKLNSTGKKALDQIMKRRYYEKYLLFKKPITLVGLSFNIKKKQLNFDWIKKESPH